MFLFHIRSKETRRDDGSNVHLEKRIRRDVPDNPRTVELNLLGRPLERLGPSSRHGCISGTLTRSGTHLFLGHRWVTPDEDEVSGFTFERRSNERGNVNILH